LKGGEKKMKLDVKAFALANGIIWGLAIFIMTVWVLMRGGGETLILLEQFFIGYSISYAGALIGLAYGFVGGFICGGVFSWLYNRFVCSSEE
jgi:hypothetical protein